MIAFAKLCIWQLRMRNIKHGGQIFCGYATVSIHVEPSKSSVNVVSCEGELFFGGCNHKLSKLTDTVPV